MTIPRPALDLIRLTYQVADDEVIRYHPRLAGAVDIPLTPFVDITRTEGAMLDRLTFDKGFAGLVGFNAIVDLSFKSAIARYPDMPLPQTVDSDDAATWQNNDGHRDAFRHAYWNALMTREYGRGWAATFGTAHEARPGNEANREAMDLYNNAVGRSIAAEHPNASKEQLGGLVQQALLDGRLIVKDARGQLAWSDKVRVGAHGLSPPETTNPALPVPRPERTLSSSEQMDSFGSALDAMYRDPRFDQAAAALDAQGLNPLDAHVIYRNAVRAGLASVQRIELGHPVMDADGRSTRHLFAFGDRQPGVAGRDYAMVTQRELASVQPLDAATDAMASREQRNATMALQAEPSRHPAHRMNPAA